MVRRLRLETFDSAQSPASSLVVMDPTEIEEMRVQAYESGYRAGWDDASASHASERAELHAEVGRNLQAMSFTYHEARAQLLRALEPLLGDLVARLLPELARAALPGQISALLLPLAEQATEVPVMLLVNPAVRADVETLIGMPSGLPLIIEESAALAPGQASLRLGKIETRIELDATVAAISTLVRDFFLTTPAREASHG
jgi:hypothetical protein